MGTCLACAARSKGYDCDDLGKICLREAHSCPNCPTSLAFGLGVWSLIFPLPFPPPISLCMSLLISYHLDCDKNALSSSDGLVIRIFTIIICIYFFSQHTGFLKLCLHCKGHKF